MSAGLDASTTTPGITAPEASRTMPAMLPVCPYSTAGKRTNPMTTTASLFVVFIWGSSEGRKEQIRLDGARRTTPAAGTAELRRGFRRAATLTDLVQICTAGADHRTAALEWVPRARVETRA